MHAANIGNDRRRRAVAQGGGAARRSSRSSPGVNVGEAERVMSAVLGGTLVLLGLGRRSLSGAAAALAGAGLIYRGVSGRCHVYQALDINTAAPEARRHEGRLGADEPEVERSITIERPADELYRRWRDPETTARVMGFFADVQPGADGTLRWSAQGPFGRTLTWETRIVEERENELIRWESLPGGQLASQGSVRFRPAPGDLGTEVKLRIRFHPPGGALGSAVARFMGGLVPNAIAGKALRFFKSLVLTGEIPTTEHQPAARADTR